MNVQEHAVLVHRVSDVMLRTAMEAIFVALGAAIGADAADVLLNVEHTIVESVRDLASSADLETVTQEAAVRAVKLIREAADNAHQRLGSAMGDVALLNAEAA